MINALIRTAAPAADNPKPTITGRLGELLGKTQRTAATAQQLASEAYIQILETLVDCETDPSTKMPDAEVVAATCEAAGVSVDELSAAVQTELRRREIVTELNDEQAAKTRLAELRQQTIDHKANFEATVKDLQAKGDEIAESLRNQESTVSAFVRLRSELAGLATTSGPTGTEDALMAKLRKLQDHEARLQLRNGRTVLPERFTKGTIEDSEPYQKHTDNARRIAELETDVRNSKSTGGQSREHFILRKLYAAQRQLESTLARDKQAYELGGQIAETRKQIAETSEQLNQFRADREAMMQA